jgi:Flp pilus assembly protein TadG
MMRKLDQRGVAALEFCIIAVPLFFLMFAVFDLGRYVITMQSLRALANAGARAVMLTYDATSNTYTGCTGDPLPSRPAKEAVAPFLYFGGYAPELAVGALTVTASSNFKMQLPIWGTAFNAPSAASSIPFCGS